MGCIGMHRSTPQVSGAQLWGATHHRVHVLDPKENITFHYKVTVAPGTNWSLLAYDDEYIMEVEEFQPTRAEGTCDHMEGI